MRYKILENELYERWDDILERMKIDFDISDVSFRTFIKKLSFVPLSSSKQETPAVVP